MQNKISNANQGYSILKGMKEGDTFSPAVNWYFITSSEIDDYRFSYDTTHTIAKSHKYWMALAYKNLMSNLTFNGIDYTSRFNKLDNEDFYFADVSDIVVKNMIVTNANSSCGAVLIGWDD